MSDPETPSRDLAEPSETSPAHETETQTHPPVDPAGETPVDTPVETAVEEPVPPPGEYRAKAGSYYRNVRYLIFVAALALGGYFLYDGFVGYPEQNRRYDELLAEQTRLQDAGDEAAAAEVRQQLDNYDRHSETDILVQKVLGFALPPLAILLMGRWWYISRGEVRLDASDTLHVPGREPIPLASINAVDDTLWERKGISYVQYSGPEGQGRAKLDDFVYERGPIDKIHDRLKHLVQEDDG